MRLVRRMLVGCGISRVVARTRIYMVLRRSEKGLAGLERRIERWLIPSFVRMCRFGDTHCVNVNLSSHLAAFATRGWACRLPTLKS